MKSMFHCTHWRQHVALDVGTASTRIATGIAPFIEKSSKIGAKPALRNGVIVDMETISNILKPLLDQARVFGIVKPRVLACAPSDARREERQFLTDSIMKSGAASVFMVPEPLAAAIGSGLDVSLPYAQMIIDIGEGVSDCAIIKSSKIHATCATRLGCDHMRRSIIIAAEKSGYTKFNDSYADMLMRTYGLKRSVDFDDSLLAANALRSVLKEIAATIDSFLKDLPHTVGSEIIDSGICLTGGGAMIPGVREFFEEQTGISVTVSSNPRASVVEGARAILPVIQMLNQWK